ncbi:MAG: endonuclease [Candidatus Sumerlaeaceae bacterium]|nr:endonuclease [Candidatus Sumerlaeaceae bacterium]
MRSFCNLQRLALVVASLASSALAIAGTPLTYYATADGTNGTTLRDSLTTIVTTGDSAVLYGNTEAAVDYTDQDPGNSSNIILMYSGASRAKTQFGGTQDGNPATGNWNREHIFPQSFFNSNEPMLSDLHALMPTDADTNSTGRNNKYYDNLTGSPTTDTQGNRWNSAAFEVTAAQRGDAARAALYMDLRYSGASGEPDLYVDDTTSPAPGTGDFRMAVKTTLLGWHLSDPPDAFERTRNSKVYNKQGNANPFVDHPEYVSTIFGGTAWSMTDNNTITVGTTDRAPATTLAGTSSVGVMSLNLTLAANEWHVGQINFTQLGTLTDSEVSYIKVYHDVDNSGTVTTDDSILSTATLSGGAASAVISPAFYLAPGTMNLLVVADLASNATAGRTLRLQLNANGIIHNATGGNDLDTTNSAIAAGTTTVQGGGAPGDVKIAYVSTRGTDGTASKEFIVLANHTNDAIAMTNWTIRRSTQPSTTSTLTITSNTLPGKGHFLIGSSTYGLSVEGVVPDYSDSNGIGLTGGFSDASGSSLSVSLINPVGTKIDGVSWNGGTAQAEGTPLSTAFHTSTSTSSLQLLRRLRPANPGPYTDTDNNSSDTVIDVPAGGKAAYVYNSSNVTVPVAVSRFTAE